MAYTALYRVWRPQTFSDIVGQTHVTTTLRNALREGRLSHAYLFSGPRGTGKTSAAKIMAKAVNCERPHDGEPCNECGTCRAIAEGSVTDILEIDAASNRGVEEIRDIRDKVRFAPSDVTYKVYIIDEVHMLTTEAFNALLKTLEEPPSHVLFILATTEPHKLPATIISRCQRFDFHRISLADMVERLQHICRTHQVQAEPQALTLVAKMAEGGMRDALSLLDQAISYAGETVRVQDVLQITGAVAQTYFSDFARQIAQRDVAAVLELFDRIVAQGKDPEQFLQDFLFYFRDMLLYKTAPRLAEAAERALVDEQFAAVAASYELPALYDAIETLNQSLTQVKWSTNSRVLAELTLVRLCQPSSAAAGTASPLPAEVVEALTRRVRELEEKVAQLLRGVPPAASPAPAAEEPRRRAEPRRAPAALAGGATRTPMSKVREVARAVDEAMTQRIRGAWSQILAEVKKVKIQHHAWLVNGQPVAAGSDAVVVAFKSPIHCDKTMEPELKGVVERVIQEVCGQPLALLSVMEDQWQSLPRDADPPQQAAEEPDPFVAEAVKLVGESLIEVKE